MLRRRDQRLFVRVASATSAILLVGSGAGAQDAAPSPSPAVTEGAAQSGELERVVITGSNIPTAAEASAQPVQSLGRQGIDRSGALSVSQLLSTSVPQVLGSGNYRGEQVNNPGGGEATIALRGLGPDDTLTLINGKRMPRSSTPTITSLGFNLNTVPFGAVQKIDVLREGASPIYGSDAVAGVVNIILRDEFEGVQIDGQYGITDKGDAETYQGSFITGFKNDRDSVVVTGSYFRQNGFKETDRPEFASANHFRESRAGKDGRSGASSPGRIFDPTTGDGLILDSGVAVATSPADFRAFDGSPTGNDRFDFDHYFPLTLDLLRYGTTATIVHKLTEDGHIRLRAEVLYNRTETQSYGAPTPLFTDQEGPPVIAGVAKNFTIPAANPVNPFKQDVTDYYYRFKELGLRGTYTDIDTYRFYGGLEGELLENRVRWNAGFLYALENSTTKNTGLINKTELYNQVSNTDPTVVTWNPFASVQYNLSGTRAAATKRLRLTALADGTSELYSFNFNTNADLFQLPAGYLSAALGVEWRSERLDIEPDSAITAFNTIGAVNQLPTVGARRVTSVYGELFVPFISSDMKIPLVYALDGRVALRMEDYSDFGAVLKPGVTLRYQPLQELTLRANYTEGFSAPALQYIHQGSSESFDSINSNPLDPTQIQVRALRVGNPNLQPTTSRSFDVGAIWSPSFIPEQYGKLTVRADLYYIEKQGLIDVPPTSTIVQEALVNNNDFYKKFITFTPNGRTIANVTATYFNDPVLTRVQGIDYGFDYSKPLDAGKYGVLNLSGEITYLWKYIGQAGAVAGKELNPGDAYPRNRGTLNLGYTLGGFEFATACNYVGSYESANALYSSATPQYASGATQHIHEYITFDTQIGYMFTGREKETVQSGRKQVVDGNGKAVVPETSMVEHLKWYRNLGLYFGVKNVFDERPPFVSIDGYDATLTDPTGRFFYVKLSKKF